MSYNEISEPGLEKYFFHYSEVRAVACSRTAARRTILNITKVVQRICLAGENVGDQLPLPRVRGEGGEPGRSQGLLRCEWVQQKETVFESIGKFSLALAVAGGVANSALYNTDAGHRAIHHL